MCSTSLNDVRAPLLCVEGEAWCLSNSQNWQRKRKDRTRLALQRKDGQRQAWQTVLLVDPLPLIHADSAAGRHWLHDRVTDFAFDDFVNRSADGSAAFSEAVFDDLVPVNFDALAFGVFPDGFANGVAAVAFASFPDGFADGDFSSR